MFDVASVMTTVGPPPSSRREGVLDSTLLLWSEGDTDRNEYLDADWEARCLRCNVVVVAVMANARGDLR